MKNYIFIILSCTIAGHSYSQDRIILKSTLENKTVKIEKLDSFNIYVIEYSKTKIYKRSDIIAYVYNYWNNGNKYQLANASDSSRYLISEFGRVRDLYRKKTTEEVFKNNEIKEYQGLSNSKDLGFIKLSDTLVIKQNQNMFITMRIDSLDRKLSGKYVTCNDSIVVLKVKFHNTQKFYQIPVSMIRNCGVETSGLFILRVTYISIFWSTLAVGNITIIHSFKQPYYKKTLGRMIVF
jgi:hypothetical protein